MNKAIHKKVNIVETVCVLVGITCMFLAAMFRTGEYMYIAKPILFTIGIIMEVVVVSIELILFHLELIPYKFASVGFYVLELVLTMLVNTTIPFSGLLVVTTFSIVKNLFRIFKVDMIYKPLGYYELCKKFGIKVKKPRKARASATKKSTTPVKSPAKRKTTKSREPEYA